MNIIWWGRLIRSVISLMDLIWVYLLQPGPQLLPQTTWPGSTFRKTLDKQLWLKTWNQICKASRIPQSQRLVSQLSTGFTRSRLSFSSSLLVFADLGKWYREEIHPLLLNSLSMSWRFGPTMLSRIKILDGTLGSEKNWNVSCFRFALTSAKLISLDSCISKSSSQFWWPCWSVSSRLLSCQTPADSMSASMALAFILVGSLLDSCSRTRGSVRCKLQASFINAKWWMWRYL